MNVRSIASVDICIPFVKEFVCCWKFISLIPQFLLSCVLPAL
jgi:hypothetical protein